MVGLCEDDDELRGVIKRALEGAGFAVRATSTGGDAVRAFSQAPPDALVLDIGLPDSDGRDVCQALRAQGVLAPVLFLTARDGLPDRLSGFHAGGDDYLTKPFALAELTVRIRALMRRAGVVRDSAPGDPPLVLDPTTHGVCHDGKVQRLTPTEFRVLAALAARRGEVVTRGALTAAAWPDGAIVNQNTLDAYLARLRRKIRAVESPAVIETLRGVGYVLR
jgi:two-component system response regulator MprA